MYFGHLFSSSTNKGSSDDQDSYYNEVRRFFRRVPHCIPERYKIAVSRNAFNLYRFNRKIEKLAQKSEDLSKKKVDDFEIGQLLGVGKFGRVYLARDKKNDEEVAMKVLNKSEIKLDKLEHQVEREVSIQSRLKHPNIIQLYSYFTDSKRIYLVMEVAFGGEIFDHLRNSPMRRFTNPVAAKYSYQVADALLYCHNHNVIHRDIKPENLILTADGDIKLTDFGWSVNASSKRKTLCGTLDYIAPEMIEKQYYGRHVDHWCLGVLIYEFLVGTPPFQSEDDNETFHRIISGDYSFPDFVCNQAMDLISRLLRKNPYERLPLNRVKQHEWISFRNMIH